MECVPFIGVLHSMGMEKSIVEAATEYFYFKGNISTWFGKNQTIHVYDIEFMFKNTQFPLNHIFWYGYSSRLTLRMRSCMFFVGYFGARRFRGHAMFIITWDITPNFVSVYFYGAICLMHG